MALGAAGVGLGLDVGDLVAELGGAFEVEVGSGELHLRSEFLEEAGDFFARDALEVKAGSLRLLGDKGAETGGDFLLD